MLLPLVSLSGAGPLELCSTVQDSADCLVKTQGGVIRDNPLLVRILGMINLSMSKNVLLITENTKSLRFQQNITWLTALHVYLSCRFLDSSVVKVTFSVQPRFLFRHLSRFLLLLARRLPGVSALGEAAAAAGETDEEERLRPGTLGALLAGDRRSEEEADCCEPETALLPLPPLPLLSLGGEDLRRDSFLSLFGLFLFLVRLTKFVGGRLTLLSCCTGKV